MDFWGGVSIACTLASGFGAIKSMTCYKKSKQITMYAKTSIAYIESQNIIRTLNEMLRLSNSKLMRLGTRSYYEQVCKNGESIKASIDKIRENMSVEDYKDVKELLNSQELAVNQYIDSFITGSIFVNNELKIYDNFNICQKKFSDMQLLIKQKLENYNESSNGIDDKLKIFANKIL